MFLIKQKQRKFKKIKTYLNETIVENRSDKNSRDNTFLEHRLTNSGINECNIILLIIHSLLITYTYTYSYNYETFIQKQSSFLKISQMSQGNTCVGVSFLQSCEPSGLQLYSKETPAQVLSCEICEILKNTCFEERWPENFPPENFPPLNSP